MAQVWGSVLDGFRDIKPFVIGIGWGMSVHAREDSR